ncbi:MAG: SCO family protein [Planctomycetota bacterium]
MKSIKWISLAATGALLGVLAVMIVVPRLGLGAGFGPGGGDSGGPIERYWPAPNFTLTNQAGQAVTTDDLRGKVWAADFFFTQCPGICPMLFASMVEVRDHFATHPHADELSLVSFTLDPENDTAEVLAETAAAIDATPDQWQFFTGDRAAIWRLSEQGFKLGVAETPDDPVNPISHPGKIVLVDRDGIIRGFYDGLTRDGVAALKRDLARLLEGA